MLNRARQLINKVGGHKQGMIPKGFGKVSMEQKSSRNLEKMPMPMPTFHHPILLGRMVTRALIEDTMLMEKILK